ncbi:MAG: dCMP deaminase family protein [Candidatus Eisenbacteria sp.]|nr:dCMP deaminase family protein [Candidatus Eisenbacteria bacterium]
MNTERPSKDDYYLSIALEISRRGTCLRRNYGSVIVNRDHIVSTGYSGAPRGQRNCIDIGVCERQRVSVPPGERYELCRSVHAEMNAIIHASREQMIGGTLYLAGTEHSTGAEVYSARPCKLCARVIINAGIEKVTVRETQEKIHTYKVADWIRHEDFLSVP